MLPTLHSGPTRHRRLLHIVDRLDATDQAAVLAFAEFLLQRKAKAEDAQPPKDMAPHPIPRPEKESVVGAIKRLAKTYPMLDRQAMLHETSTLMGEHVMQGREAKAVIDDLEALFARHYDFFCQKQGKGEESEDG